MLIEDEAVTARNLAYLLQVVDPGIRIVAMLPGVQEAIAWLQAHPAAYDLVFSDIRLADGLSFEVFRQVPVQRPVVFVTAYDDYALEAFRHNGIDYLLKPFDEAEIRRALEKYRRLVPSATAGGEEAKLATLLELLSRPAPAYRRSFLVRARNKLVPVEAAHIAWIYTAHELVYAYTPEGQQYLLDETLEELEAQLDPQVFCRANRQFLVNRQAVRALEPYFNGRLLVQLQPVAPEPVLVSKARAGSFRDWLNR